MTRKMTLIALAALLSLTAVADVPGLVNYQGQLTDNTPDRNAIDATLPMEFRIYGSPAGSDLLWQESWGGVEVVDGIFAVLLGSQTPLPADLFSASTSRYLEVVVMGETLAPRQRLGSVPFAHVSDKVDVYDGVELEESAEIDADVAAHDTTPAAHAALIASHTHHSHYYTEEEIDARLPWGDWTIVNDDSEDRLQFLFPDGGGQPEPVVTLETPSASGNVGIGTESPAEKLEVAGAIKIGTTLGSGEGTIRYTGSDFEGRIGDAWMTLSSAEVTRADVKVFGAVGDGVTDDSAAIQAAIDSLAEGGVVFFPDGRYLVTTQLTFPTTLGPDGIVRQKPYRLSGTGAWYEPQNKFGGEPSGGSILDLRYDGGPKIATYGTGLVEIDKLTLARLDFDVDTAPFLYTTNSTLHVHDTTFWGGGLGNTSIDAIILGGVSSVDPGGADPDGPFQGYGTVIRDNFFGRIRRAIYGRVYANGIAFIGNTVWSNSGSSLPDGAAIEIDGDPEGLSDQSASGWYVAGNLIEMTGYDYGVKTRESQRNAFIANNFFDPGPQVQAHYRFEPTGRLNFVVAGFHEDTVPFVEDHAVGNSRSTVLNFHQDRESRFAQKVRFLNQVHLEPGSAQPSGPRVVSLDGTELSYRLAGENGMIVSYTPDGGSPIDLWQVWDLGAGVVTQELQGTDARLRNVNGHVRVLADADSFLELGNVAGQGIRVEDGDLTFTTTSIQVVTGAGAPLMPAPDGSIYLRSDGGPGATLYVREGGVWVGK